MNREKNIRKLKVVKKRNFLAHSYFADIDRSWQECWRHITNKRNAICLWDKIKLHTYETRIETMLITLKFLSGYINLKQHMRNLLKNMPFDWLVTVDLEDNDLVRVT